MKFWRGPDGAGPRLSDGTRVVLSGQPSEARPAIVAASYFDAAAGITYFGVLKRWNGSSWVKGRLVVYTGAWVAKPLTRWDGSDWKLVDTTGV
jgi:hypothetical protein